MDADNTFRANEQPLSKLKAAQGKTPSYLYYFAWRFPVRNGQMKAADIPFALHNVDSAASMTRPRGSAYALAHNISAAFASFARIGNPSHKDLPNWPVFNSRTHSTMVFANECEMLNGAA
jgi:para-nitrobenzyl esterase